MAERADPADVFTWRMVDAIRYCADLAATCAGSPQTIEVARPAATQMALIIPPREKERFEVSAHFGEPPSG